MPANRKTAIVTGAGQGLGRGVALRLSQEGYDLALLDRQDCDETARLVVGAGCAAHKYIVDVADEASVASTFQKMDEDFGPPAAVVNAAGIFRDTPFLETTAEDWDRVLAVNSRGPFLVGREGARRMTGAGGAIVNILSNAAAQGFAGESAYCASKGATLLLTRTMAIELARYGITVNGVGPGTSETPMGGDYLGEGPIAGHELSRTPMGRWGQPADIAEAVLFFVDRATWITGQALYVDGGFLATGLPDFDGR